jgi:hypothetical protein
METENFACNKNEKSKEPINFLKLKKDEHNRLF